MSYSQSSSKSNSIAPLCSVARQHLWPSQTPEAYSPMKQLDRWPQHQSAWKSIKSRAGSLTAYEGNISGDFCWRCSMEQQLRITSTSLKGCWEVSSPTSCSKQGQWGGMLESENFQAWRTHNLSEFQCLTVLLWKGFFLHIARSSPVSTYAHWLSFSCHAPLESLAPSTWPSSLRSWQAAVRSPQSHLSSRLNKASSLSLSSCADPALWPT